VQEHFYVLVRTDLPLPQQIVQAVHAAHEAGRSFPCDGTPSVVVCRTPSEATLLREGDKLAMLGIPTTIFREPDIGDEATALATAPVDISTRRIFSKWQLWNGG
jgi:hypothetical protein